MRATWLITVVGMVLVSTGVARAGFVVTTLRAPLGPGSNFAGKDGVTLFIRNDGVGTTDPTFGADLIFYDVALSSTAANPQFFIHAWDGLGHNAITPSANTKADFGWRGFVYGDANRDGQVSSNDFGILTSNFGQPNRTWSTADFTGDHQVSSNDFGLLTTNFAGPLLTAGSYVRFGSAAQFDSFFPLSTSPGESSQTFTDGQSVTGFDVTTLSLSSTTPGLPDSVATQLAFAVVPTGQPVTFTWSAAGHTGPTSTNFITDGGGGLSPAAVPEPAALGLVGLCGLLLARRRS